MNLIEAVKARLEGKKIKKVGFRVYLDIDGGDITFRDINGKRCNFQNINVDELGDDCWEVVKEWKCNKCVQKLDYYEKKADYCLPCSQPQTLSDKFCSLPSEVHVLVATQNRVAGFDDVCEHIKELMNCPIIKQGKRDGNLWYSKLMLEIQRIFGEDLI